MCIFPTTFVAPLPLKTIHVVIESISSILISWDPPPSSYVFYYLVTVTGGEQTVIMNTTVTSLRWNQLRTNVHYNISISAVNPLGASTVVVNVTSLLGGTDCMKY